MMDVQIPLNVLIELSTIIKVTYEMIVRVNSALGNIETLTTGRTRPTLQEKTSASQGSEQKL